MGHVAEKPTVPGADPDPLVGSRWGRYRIDALLGRGRRASVYRARDIATTRVVAIRILDRELADDESFGAHFHQSMAAAAAVRHPHIVPIVDHGEHDGAAFVARPYVEGGTLRERLGRPLPFAEVLRLLRPIAEALDAAHQRGLVHGDLKPGSILLPSPERPLLTDLGTARALPQRENNVVANARGAQFGTPEYLSPEQALGRPLDGRTDLYALGVILYEALTGRPPFRAEGVADAARTIAMSHASTPPPRPSDLNPALGAEVEAVLLRALAKEPGERYTTGAALIAALELAAAPEAMRGVAASTPVAAAPRPWSRPVAMFVGILVLALVLGGLGIAAVLSNRTGMLATVSSFPDPTPAPPPPPGRQWFFADSWSGEGYRTVVTVQNPGPTAASVTLSFIGEDGPLPDHRGTVPAGGSIDFDLGAINVGNYSYRVLGHRITADQPVTVTHKISNQTHGTSTHGAIDEGTVWRFLENWPNDQHDKWLELANFGEAEATFRVSFKTAGGKGATRTFGLTGGRIVLIDLNREFPEGIGRWTVEVTNGVPIVAEMTVYDRDENIVSDMIGELVR